MKEIRVKRIGCVFFIFLLMINFYSCSKTRTGNKAFLTEEAVQNFIKHHKDLNLSLLKLHEQIKPYIKISKFNPENTLTKLQNMPTPKLLKNLFKKFGLDENKAVMQITVMQYGIIAYTMEATLEEIKNSGEERNEYQKASDLAVENYAKKLKALINEDDYKLIKKYHSDLFAAFDNFKGWNESE
ncbi:MAG: hypothetical protein CR988_06430 [Treponema sp.]|nr:MAG: hypothetical protein CR988_06430 [Treponema sp.]